jgi:NAD(P)H-hydrate epimerase
MRRLISCEEATRLDASTMSKAAIPSILLMEDASVGLWTALEPIARSIGAGDSGLLLALCGSGNNGGDALALLRHASFAGLSRIAVILSRTRLDEPSSIYSSSLKSLGVPVLAWDEERADCERLMTEAGLIVDGLAGTGLSGALQGNLLALAEAARDCGVPIVSIDLPSGLSDHFEYGFPLVKASWTLSIGPRKACQYYPFAREACGEILDIEGVFPKFESKADMERTALLEEGDLERLAPLPSASAYKGERGRVAVFAGSPGTSGAAVLASRSCLAAGAGMSALFASPDLFPIASPMLESVMVKREPAIGAFEASRWDSLLVGPGWGKGPERREHLASLLSLGLPAVIDADAIELYRNLLDSGFAASSPIVLTPHPGEFAALTGIDSNRALADPPSYILEAAKSLGAIIVLKSQVTWISSPDGALAVWDGRESGLGTAGSGDVLAGLAAGLLARAAARHKAGGIGHVEAFAAARAAVIAHGLAGRESRSRMGWFEASALIGEAARILGRGGAR